MDNIQTGRSLAIADLPQIVQFTCCSLFAAFAVKSIYIGLSNAMFLSTPIPWLALFYTIPNFSVAGLFSALLLAPLFETAIFVVLVYQIITKVSARPAVFITLSSCLFALFHYPSGGWFRVLMAAVAGVVFAYAYVFFRQRLHKDHAAFAVIGVHLLNNLLLIAIHWLVLM